MKKTMKKTIKKEVIVAKKVPIKKIVEKEMTIKKLSKSAKIHLIGLLILLDLIGGCFYKFGIVATVNGKPIYRFAYIKELQTKFYNIKNLKQGDKILFCTDGISDNLTDNQIGMILKEDSDEAYYLAEIAKKISKSGKPRSKMDDMSAIVVII